MPLKAVIADENENPVCPFCDTRLTEVKIKTIAQDSFSALTAGGGIVFFVFCPHCKRVLATKIS